jgi:hypothetical protein
MQHEYWTENLTIPKDGGLRMLRLFTAVWFTMLVAPTHASDTTGTDLFNNCQQTLPTATDLHKGVYCLEYVSGFVDNMMLVQRIKGVNASLFCLPYSFKMGDAVDAILAYGQANTERRDAHISVFTWNALKEAYPCP